MIVFLTSSRGQTLHADVVKICPDDALIISFDEQSAASDEIPTDMTGGKQLSVRGLSTDEENDDFVSVCDRNAVRSWRYDGRAS